MADQMDEPATEEELNMMIKMGDYQNQKGVGLEDFIVLMKELGLIPQDKKE